MKKISTFICVCTFTLGAAFSLHAQQPDTVRVKVHGHVMPLYVAGSGEPTIVLEAGLGASHKAWEKVQMKLAQMTRVVSYDRPGYLAADTCPAPRDAVTVARELKEALNMAGINPPYILAGWSLGGAFVRVFSGMYPTDVAGLLLVDPAPEEAYARFTREYPELMAEDSIYVQEMLNSRTRIGEREEMRSFDSSMAQARRSDQMHATPTTLLIAAGKAPGGQNRDTTNPLNRIWVEELVKWAKGRPNLKYKIIGNSGHHIAGSQPDTVVHAIGEMVHEYRRQQHLGVAALHADSVAAHIKPHGRDLLHRLQHDQKLTELHLLIQPEK